jgi:cell division protein FtsQ
MWDNAQALRQLADTLFAISLLLVVYGVLNYTVHLPVFALRTLQLSSAPQRVDVAQIEAVMRNELRGNFFTVDLEGMRHTFEQIPWVRKVNVRRHFPWQLEVALEEHVTLARWNETELVNTYGEVFTVEAGQDSSQSAQNLPKFAQNLPKFIGQADTAAEVTQMFSACSEQLAPLKQEITQISLSPRRAWQLRLRNGMVLELGREQAQQRLARFVAVYPYSLATMQRAASYVDLRYQNGFAAYMPDHVTDKNKQG